MYKYFFKGFIGYFLLTVINGKVGTPLFKGAGVIRQKGPNGIELDLNLGADDKYEITIRKVK